MATSARRRKPSAAPPGRTPRGSAGRDPAVQSARTNIARTRAARSRDRAPAHRRRHRRFPCRACRACSSRRRRPARRGTRARSTSRPREGSGRPGRRSSPRSPPAVRRRSAGKDRGRSFINDRPASSSAGVATRRVGSSGAMAANVCGNPARRQCCPSAMRRREDGRARQRTAPLRGEEDTDARCQAQPPHRFARRPDYSSQHLPTSCRYPSWAGRHSQGVPSA